MSLKIFLFVFASSFCMLMHAQTEGSQYPLDDPRNPNCPCHAHQKKAEEEYRQQLANENNSNKNTQQKTQAEKIKNTNSQPLAIQNQLMQQPLPDISLNQADNRDFPALPQLAAPALNNSGTNFSLKLAKPSFGGYSGVSVKYKKHRWKKFSFKTSLKFKKVFHHKKKIKVKHTSCFKW